MSAVLKSILIALGIASIFLIIGLVLRSKIKFLQKLFLPASVIGGFLGLIAITLLKLIPSVSETVIEYNSILDAIPAILIVPIFASTPLGNFAKKEKKQGKQKAAPSISNGIFWIMCGIMAVQIVIGLCVNFIFTKTGSDVPFYNAWGLELAAGFVGGHGTAASIGNIYSQIPVLADLSSVGKDVATTFASIGLIGGMVFGIIFINIAARKGKTAIMQKPISLEGTSLTGLEKDITKQESLGRETSKNFSIETISIHLAVILAVVTASYGISYLLSIIPKVGALLKQLPVWSISMVLMLLVNKLISALKLEWLFDRKVVQRISGFLTDFAIVCAIASMNLQTLATYIVPILICSVIAFVVTYFYIFKLTKFVTKEDATFEHAIIGWGTSTGVLMTGLVLLKICDPNYETPALNNYTKGFAVMSIVQALILGVLVPILVSGNDTLGLLIVFGIVALVFTAGAVVVGLLRKKLRTE